MAYETFLYKFFRITLSQLIYIFLLWLWLVCSYYWFFWPRYCGEWLGCCFRLFERTWPASIYKRRKEWLKSFLCFSFMKEWNGINVVPSYKIPRIMSKSSCKDGYKHSSITSHLFTPIALPVTIISDHFPRNTSSEETIPIPRRNVLRLRGMKGDWPGTRYSISYASRNNKKKLNVHLLIRWGVLKVIVLYYF